MKMFILIYVYTEFKFKKVFVGMLDVSTHQSETLH